MEKQKTDTNPFPHFELFPVLHKLGLAVVYLAADVLHSPLPSHTISRGDHTGAETMLEVELDPVQGTLWD